MQDADSQDVAQQVLLSVSNRIVEWRPNQQAGSFRRWLTRITTNAAIDVIRKHCRSRTQFESEMLPELASPDSQNRLDRQQFEAEHRRAVFRWAAQRIRHEFQDVTWQAFWLTTVAGETASSAATQLNHSVGSIYTARSRVMRRLQQVVEKYETE